MAVCWACPGSTVMGAPPSRTHERPRRRLKEVLKHGGRRERQRPTLGVSYGEEALRTYDTNLFNIKISKNLLLPQIFDKYPSGPVWRRCASAVRVGLTVESVPDPAEFLVLRRGRDRCVSRIGGCDDRSAGRAGRPGRRFRPIPAQARPDAARWRAALIL
jgi:hypothetical protein